MLSGDALAEPVLRASERLNRLSAFRRATARAALALSLIAWPVVAGPARVGRIAPAAFAGVMNHPGSPALAQRRGGRRRGRGGRVKRILKAPYKAVKVSVKAFGRGIRKGFRRRRGRKY